MGETKPKRARRFVIGALAVVGVLVALAVALPLVISPDLIKARIVDQIAFWTGREFTFRGEPHLSLYPYLTVRLNDARLANAEGMGDEPFIEVEYDDRQARNPAAASRPARIRPLPSYQSRVSISGPMPRAVATGSWTTA